MAAKPIPEGFHTVSPYLVVKNTKKALELYSKAFGAEAGMSMTTPDGNSVVHAEMRIGNSTIMLSDENPQWDSKSPATLGGSPVTLHLYVEDADALFKRAVDAGCKPLMPPMDAFWGDRYGKVIDPEGYHWGIATHKEDLTPEEIEKRGAEWFAQTGGEGGGGS